MLITNEARIETCTKCNYQCEFCTHPTHFARKEEIMSLETYRFIIDKLRLEAPYILESTISGFGEAFLDPTIFEKIKYSIDNGLNVHTLTNGSTLNEDKIDTLFKYNVEDIRISLHSIKPENYCRITGATPAQHRKVLHNINYIINNKDYTRLVITIDVVDINKDEVDEIINLYSDRVDLLEVWRPHNWVDVLDYRTGPIIKDSCGRPINSPLQIQVDGTINMCCFDYNGVLLLGDFMTQTLDEIFESEVYLDLRKQHILGTLAESNYICKNCDQRRGQNDAVIYNSKFSGDDRLNRTSTNYRKV